MRLTTLFASLIVALPLTAMAQQDNSRVPRMQPSSEQLGRAAYSEAFPDLPGNGDYPAAKYIDDSLPQHTIYAPSDISSLGDRKLKVLLFGNGGCGNDGASARNHHLEIASHGYLVLVPGRIYSGPGAEAKPERQIDPVTKRPVTATSPQDLVVALDWAEAENSRHGSALFGVLNMDKVAVSGWSCGGLQALNIAVSDDRIKTLVMHNTGTFPEGNVILDIAKKEDLAKVNVPAIYLIGGPSDIAYPNAVDDFARIDHVPAVMANLQVGHSGTFAEPYGGRVAQVTLDWLDWQLDGDRSAARSFLGKACRLCVDPTWTIQRKGL